MPPCPSRKGSRYENDVGSACDAGVERDPAGVAPHDLYDDHAMVSLRRGVQSIDRVGCEAHGRIESERVVVSAMSLSIVFGTQTMGLRVCRTRWRSRAFRHRQ